MHLRHLYAGNRRELTFELRWGGVEFDATGWALEFLVERPGAGENPVISKIDGGLGTSATFVIEVEDSVDIPTADYVGYVRASLGSDHRTVATTALKVLAERPGDGGVPENVLTFHGETITFGGEILTFG